MKFFDLAITLGATAMNAYAGVLSLVGAKSVRATAARLGIPIRYMTPFGFLLVLGSAGLLVGLAQPSVGAAAASGLTLYFTCAVAAHIRARHLNLAGALAFLTVALAALVAVLRYREPW